MSGPPILLLVDLQPLFSELESPWAGPALERCLPALPALLAAIPRSRRLATRFVPPEPLPEAGGWGCYWRDHAQVAALTRKRPALLDLHPAVIAEVPPEQVLAKTGYAPPPDALANLLAPLGAGEIRLAGIETDACVLAVALALVDLGREVAVIADAVASPDAVGHAAVLEHVLPRLGPQIRIVQSRDLPAGGLGPLAPDPIRLHLD